MDAFLHPGGDISFIWDFSSADYSSNSNVTITNSWQMMDLFKSTIKLKQTLLLVNYF